MTVPTFFAKRFYGGLVGPAFRKARQWTHSMVSSLFAKLDRFSVRHRRSVAIVGSILLHGAGLLLLLPSWTGLSVTMGTATGLGEINGVGTAVTLINVTEVMPAKQSHPKTQIVSAERPPEPTVDIESPEAIEETTTNTAAEASNDAQIDPIRHTFQAPDQTSSESTSAVTAGAFGNNGQSDLDLWNAIAPCWNRIADAQTLGATLTISFSPEGGLSAPPVIERDPSAPITVQSLQSEAKALAALAECGTYPMAKGLQAVTVAFPPPATVPASGHKAMTSHQSHLLFQYLFKADQR